MRRVLVDTSAIYSFIVHNDAHYEESRAFLKSFLESPSAFLLADVVFSELMTLLKVRQGSRAALRVGQNLRQNPKYVWTPLGLDGERDTWAIFQQHDDKAWSYVDCSLFVLSRRLKIPEIFTFDEHFAQMPGVVPVP